jgi:NADPH-dependent 7-cyano-7-deazaguanine reductase QueF
MENGPIASVIAKFRKNAQMARLYTVIAALILIVVGLGVVITHQSPVAVKKPKSYKAPVTSGASRLNSKEVWAEKFTNDVDSQTKRLDALEKALETSVDVKFFKSGDDEMGLFPMTGYLDLQTFLGKDLEELEITDYNAERNHLEFEKVNFLGYGYSINENKALFANKYFTNALRSRCRHTKQKDTGAAYISINTLNSVVKPESLFKQIVSLREVNEFHEFCSEKLFKAITNHPDVEDCVVMLLYARRGSLDINPVRASKEYLIPKELIDTGFYTKKAMGQ